MVWGVSPPEAAQTQQRGHPRGGDYVVAQHHPAALGVHRRGPDHASPTSTESPLRQAARKALGGGLVGAGKCLSPVTCL